MKRVAPYSLLLVGFLSGFQVQAFPSFLTQKATQKHSGRISLLNLKKSAFGSAAIGRKKDLPKEEETSAESELIATDQGSERNPNVQVSNSKRNQNAPLRYALSTKEVLKRRDQALLALKTYLNLPLATSIEILNKYPRLYTHLTDLSSKLDYLIHDINLKPRHIRRMLETHPRLMETVLLDREENITNTIEVLQAELDLTLDDIKTMQSLSLPPILSYPRSELRKRIQVYKRDLGYKKEDIKRMVWKDPRMLRTDSGNVRQIIKVLKEELMIHTDDIHRMLKKEILLLTYKAEDNIRPTIQYLKQSPVGQSLGMVDRKGVSTLIIGMSSANKNEIIRSRLKDLIMGHPKILSSSIQKNLKPTVEFFLDDLRMTPMELGRAMYRRGGSLMEANLERTLKRKVNYLRTVLGLEVEKDDYNIESFSDSTWEEMTHTKRAIMVLDPPPWTENIIQPLTSFQKRRLLAQMLAINPDIFTLSIENNIEPKIRYFKESLGLATHELRYILLKRPQVLALSLERNIIPKMNFFVLDRSKGGFGLTLTQVCAWIIQNPQILVIVLDKRIKPRVETCLQLGLQLDTVQLDRMMSHRSSTTLDTPATSDSLFVPFNFVSMTDSTWQRWLEENCSL